MRRVLKASEEEGDSGRSRSCPECIWGFEQAPGSSSVRKVQWAHGNVSWSLGKEKGDACTETGGFLHEI